jgi:hypothetical protein
MKGLANNCRLLLKLFLTLTIPTIQGWPSSVGLIQIAIWTGSARSILSVCPMLSHCSNHRATTSRERLLMIRGGTGAKPLP